MEEINRFVMLARSGRFTVTDLCEQFGITKESRPEAFGAATHQDLDPALRDFAPSREKSNVERTSREAAKARRNGGGYDPGR